MYFSFPVEQIKLVMGAETVTEFSVIFNRPYNVNIGNKTDQPGYDGSCCFYGSY